MSGIFSSQTISFEKTVVTKLKISKKGTQFVSTTTKKDTKLVYILSSINHETEQCRLFTFHYPIRNDMYQKAIPLIDFVL